MQLLPNNFKPMLAEAVELDQVKFPVYASPKLNGVRCIVDNGVALSRSKKPLPNLFIQKWAQDNAKELQGLDGEIIVGSETASDALNQTTSGVMRIKGEPDFTFWVFDIVDANNTFGQRYNTLLATFMTVHIPKTKMVKQTQIHFKEQLKLYEKINLDKGYEGTMLKSFDGPYKFGRSSVKQGYLLKRKLFVDGEFEIVGYEPKYHNANEAYTNELGRTARSTSKEHMVALETLGALICKTKDGHTFKVGTGFDDAERERLWKIRDTLPGKWDKIKYFPEGMVDVPLLPVHLVIRDEIDMSD